MGIRAVLLDVFGTLLDPSLLSAEVRDELRAMSICEANISYFTGHGALDNCSALQRNTLAVGPAVVLFIGGVWAFVRTIQVWRARGGWWIWQGAGWFLLMLMLLVLMMTAPLALLS